VSVAEAHLSQRLPLSLSRHAVLSVGIAPISVHVALASFLCDLTFSDTPIPFRFWVFIPFIIWYDTPLTVKQGAYLLMKKKTKEL
jgi:hypothetical protein